MKRCTDLLTAGLVALCACGSAPTGPGQEGEEPQPPSRLLFIGNSYTADNGGLETVVAGLALSAHPETPLHAEEITFGGYTLEDHWDTPSTLDSINDGNWDVVVLQEQSTRPMDDPDLMMLYASLLDSVITGAGASTCLFMTWAREYDPGMIDSLAWAYGWVGESLGATVAPVGLAWQSCLTGHPELDLYQDDGSHPTPAGTYVTACVFYAVLWGESPVGTGFVSDSTITDEERLAMQEVAWETVQAYGTPP